jgi:hypothetical protein
MVKALELLKTNKSVKEKADFYHTSIKKSIERNVIDVLVSKIDEIKDKLFDLTNFTLDTNLNAGLKQMTKEDCENKFTQIIELEFDLKILELELKTKQASFDKYFKEAVITTA